MNTALRTVVEKRGQRVPREYESFPAGGRRVGKSTQSIRYNNIWKILSDFHIHVKQFLNWLAVILLLELIYSTYGLDIEGTALIELLRALNDSNNRITDWNEHFVSPCYSWSHVICSNGHVISLSLASNGFSGSLSTSITKLKYLQNLDLHDNNLSGVLPDYLSNVTQLKILNLGLNSFNGSIPATWGQLSNLQNLMLNGNLLTGSVPDSIANVKGLRELDLSSNNFTGRIPAQLFLIPDFNFTGTFLTCGSSSQQPCVSSSSHPVSSQKINHGVIVAIACAVALLLLLPGVIFVCRYFRVHKMEPDVFVDVEGEAEHDICFGQLRRYSWREMQLATDNFSERSIIGQGGFGKVYRGVLSDGVSVAVKRLGEYHNLAGEAAFQREVRLISVAVHKNLLRLIGFCTTSSERILVYPFMKNLSVASHLRDLNPGDKTLDWHMRKRVAFGAAHGLEYLHEHCNPKIIHRDLKAANILLDDEFEAVLGDFGLAKLVDAQFTHVTTKVRGTMGHIAPEYLSTGKSSEKTDVFGFGITLLELVTGQRAVDFGRLEEEENVLLLDHIKKLQREDRLDDIVDRKMGMYDQAEVETVVQVALLCTQSCPEERPRMAEVVRMLKGTVDVAQKWAEWEQLERLRNQRDSNTMHHFAWAAADDSLNCQEAIQLSSPR